MPRLEVGAGIAALVGLLALGVAMPERCSVNELGHHRVARTGDLAIGPAPMAGQAGRFERACSAGATAPGRAARPILRAPYLQDVTAAGGRVVWTAESMADPSVGVWAPGAARAEARAIVDDSAPLPRGRQYVARLEGLRPGTLYCYEVREGARGLAGPFGFTTAPAPGDGRPIRLVAFGDMGFPTIDQRAVIEQMSRVEFDLVLLAGDIAYPEGKLSELEAHFFAPYAPLMRSAPFYPASGNHDYLTADAAPFRQAFALPESGGPAGRERWYSFDWGDLHVVVLDSERLGPPQESWLEADLTAHAAARWTIALVHRAPFSSGEHGSDFPTRDAFVPILARHRVALVIAGHEHHYERFRRRAGVTYVVTGGGGRGTRRIRAASADTAFAAQVAHFVYLIVERDRIRLWAVDASGQTFDTATLVRGDRPAG
jgi:hypothetical protein